MNQDEVRYLPWLASQFSIAPLAAVVTIAALAVFVTGGGVTTYLLMTGDGTLAERLVGSLRGFAGYGALVAFPMLLVLGKARGDGAMALLGLFVAALSALGVVGALVANVLDFGWMFALFLGVWHGVFVVPIGLLGFVAFTSSVGRVRTGFERAQRDVVRRHLKRVGWSGIDALAERVAADPSDVPRLLAQARLEGVQLDDVFWLRSDLDEKVEAAAKMVAARGRVHVRDLARHLKLRPAMVRRLVAHLAEHDGFTGWVDWDNGLVVSAAATSLREARQCPRCAGEMRVEGVGMVACFHCGCEVYLPRAA